MPASPPAAPGRGLRTSLVLGIVCFLVYNANFRAIGAGDTIPARSQPFGLLRYGTLSLDPIRTFASQGHPPGRTFWMRPGADGRLISTYPVVLPVLVTPLYVPAALVLGARGWPAAPLERAAELMEKLVASLIAAASAALLHRLLRRRGSPRLALGLTLAYAFGTTTWVIGSQALWQHGLAQLLLVVALLLVTGPATPVRVAAAGAVLALLAGNRPPDALLAAGVGVAALVWARRQAPLLLAAAAVPAALILAYNLVEAGHWAGGYGLAAQKARRFLKSDPLEGIAVLLFAPARGLFVFSPFLLAIPLRFARVWADAPNRLLTAAGGLGIVLQLALYSKAEIWRDATPFGPRWLTDCLPLLFWMLPPVVASLKRPGRLLFAAGCALGVGIEAIGAFWFLGVGHPAVAGNPKGTLWDLRSAPFVAELAHAPARPEFLLSPSCDGALARGGVDLLDGRPPDFPVFAREELHVEGWALVGERSPGSVSVSVDGVPLGGTSSFFTRPDVVRAVGSTSRAGWGVAVPTAGWAPGGHLLRVDVQACPTGEPLLLGERQFLVAKGGARPPADYRCDARAAQGSLDALGGQPPAATIPFRRTLLAEGWTLVDGKTPWEVSVMLDGRSLGATRDFFARPDVASATGSRNPAGWTIRIETGPLESGAGELRVEARSCPTASPLPVTSRKVVLAPRSSAELVRPELRAAERLAGHQQPDGSWLTAYTPGPRFEYPTPEMNTFLTANLVDLLGPVAEDAGLAAVRERARDHLTAQIEATGLVRYHGLPDGPGIGRLGCAITPDADDTALVWRIAPPPGRERLRTALERLRRFRTPDGLYRTWLSPIEGYSCLDPGLDPNPADAVIQIHVLQLLAVEDPAAARELCASLAARIDDDRVWVYYRHAPIVPLLRQRDLSAAGCGLTIPAARLRTAVPGQDRWLEAVTLLRLLESGEAGPADRERATTLLRELAEDDFDVLRWSPPLLFHNDQTASVSRFYWSEDFGYALWLRLFHENARRSGEAGRGD